MLPDNNTDFKVELTQAAFEQITLIKSSDFTLEGLFFRLKIGGKGCDGFTYSTGFSEKVEDDLIISYSNAAQSLEMLIDKFTYFYCKTGVLDFILDPQRNQDGFSFENHKEGLYSGKFFQAQELVPTEDDL